MTEHSEVEKTQVAVNVGKFLGRVKWFRNGVGYGYGFITCVSENVPQSNQDIYVYQANICPNVSTFRTLVKDEYVSFDINEDERPHAVNVRGVGGGPLRCDAPKPISKQRRKHNNSSTDEPAHSNESDGLHVDHH